MSKTTINLVVLFYRGGRSATFNSASTYTSLAISVASFYSADDLN